MSDEKENSPYRSVALAALQAHKNVLQIYQNALRGNLSMPELKAIDPMLEIAKTAIMEAVKIITKMERGQWTI